MARNALITIRRGLEANIPTLAEYELGLTTDTFKLYIGSPTGNKLLVAAQSVGDMLKSIYDTDNDGKVDWAETVDWSGVQNKPTKLSQFTNDLGLNGDVKITTASVSPSNPTPNEFWYVSEEVVVLTSDVITTAASAPSGNPGDFWYQVV